MEGTATQEGSARAAWWSPTRKLVWATGSTPHQRRHHYQLHEPPTPWSKELTFAQMVKKFSGSPDVHWHVYNSPSVNSVLGQESAVPTRTPGLCHIHFNMILPSRLSSSSTSSTKSPVHVISLYYPDMHFSFLPCSHLILVVSITRPST